MIGLQWGDEAKGKLVDLLAPDHDCVVRYQGGANAGHTVVSGSEVYKLHHVPSGILHSQVMNFITPGVVIEPTTMIGELEGLEARGIDPRKNLMISERAHLVMPWHLAEDQVMNKLVVQGENIGTTLRGIGPCYRDKVGRNFAVRAIDLLQSDLPERIASIVEAKNALLRGMSHDMPVEAVPAQLDAAEITAKAERWSKQLGPLIGDTTGRLLDELENGKQLLIQAPANSDKNRYVQSLNWNAKVYENNYVNHFELLKGGSLSFRMQESPNKNKGIKRVNYPYSYSSK